MKRINLFLLAFVAALLFSCKPDNPVTPIDPNGFKVGSGVFVLNEGVYMSGNASLTFYDPEADTVVNSLFKKVNFDLTQALGDVGQSMAMADGMLYIVVNNSNYIYKMDANTIRIDTTQPFKLMNFYSPREMCFIAPNKAYVSDLMGTGLWIVNPQDMSHCGFVETGKSTEKMVLVGNELYVSNWSNYYVPGMEKNTVQVVDINNDVKVAEIQVGKEPNTMAVDKNGHVWVLCEGATWEMDGEKPSLWEIDPQLKVAHCRYTFEDEVDSQTGDAISFSATSLRSDPQGRMFYVIVSQVDEYGSSSDSEIRLFNPEALAFSETFRISSDGNIFYNIAVDPKTGELYVSCIANPINNGTVYRYSSDGVLLSSFEAGLFPNAMLFK